jgi:hypothetical protein
MKKIIYCTNVHSTRDVEHLMQNISNINDLFGCTPIFVASNGIDHIDNLPQNVIFQKFSNNESNQTGPINSVLNCLRLAAEQMSDIGEYNVIFSHPDLYIKDTTTVIGYLNSLDYYDVVCRNLNGPGGHRITGMKYYLTEDFLISGRVLDRFKNLKWDFFDSPDQLPSGILESALSEFFNILLKLNVCEIDIINQSQHIVNELGFYHDHYHYQYDLRFKDQMDIVTYIDSTQPELAEMHLDSLNKWHCSVAPSKNAKYIVTDKFIDHYRDFNQFVYDCSLNYSQRMCQALTHVSKPITLLLNQNQLIFDWVDYHKMDYFVDKMYHNTDISYIRLVPDFTTGVYYDDDFEVIDKQSKFSQNYSSSAPTLWRTDVLKNLMSSTDIQTTDDICTTSEYLKSTINIALCVKKSVKTPGGPVIGSVVPCTDPALSYGKWNTSDYPILYRFFTQYSIDPAARGTR